MRAQSRRKMKHLLNQPANLLSKTHPMTDVFFYEAFEEEAEQLRHFQKKYAFKAEYSKQTIQERGDKEPPAPIISLRTQSEIPPEWAPKLKGILARATGYDHLIAYREKTGIDVPSGYLPIYANRSVAEQAMLMWMSLARKLTVQQRQFHTFYRDGITGSEIENKQLLVVGVGNIGYEVVRVGRGLGMEVTGVDINPQHPDVTYADIDAALPTADVIVCAMNLTAENMNYFDYARLRTAKPGALFVNVSRGEQSPAVDLVRLLNEGHLGGVGLDVYHNERTLSVALRENRQVDDEECLAIIDLSKRDNAILTPHNAFNTTEAVKRKSSQSIEQIAHLLKHKTFKWSPYFFVKK